MLKKIKNYKHIHFIICLIFCAFICLPFLKYYMNGDDTVFHLENIEMYSQTSIFSKILPGTVRNMGSGIGIFYPCFPHALAGEILKVIRIFNMDVIDAIKITKALFVFLSMTSMFITAKVIYKDKKKAMFSSLFYISSSYFYVDIFTRDALNESALFMFIPLVFLSFYYLFKENNKKLFMIYFVIGYVGMIYSHLVMSVFFTMLLIPFLLIYIKDIFKNKNILYLILGSILILLLTCNFTVPLIEHMSANKWNIPYKGNWSFSIKDYIIPEYYKSNEDKGLLYIYLQNIVVVLGLLSLYKVYKNKEDSNRRYLFGLAVFTIISILFSSNKLFWDNAPDFFRTIQFAWRITTYSVFGISLFAVYSLDYILGAIKKKYVWIGSLFIIFLLGTFTYNHYQDTNFRDKIKYNDNTMKNSIIKDYLPNNSFKNIKYIEKRDGNKIIGDANINIIKNDTPYLRFEVKDVDKEVELELPRLYYLGYTITNNNGNKIDYKENKYGLITIKAKKGIYEVKYTGTKCYRISLIIKFITVGILLIFSIYSLIKTIKGLE